MAIYASDYPDSTQFHGPPAVYTANVVVPNDPPPVGTGNTCTLNDEALVRIARGAGFAGNDLQIAVAVALAESAGHVDALHFNPPAPGSYDIGLWQINDDAHPSLDRDLLFTSPGYNAAAAYAIQQDAASWSPWVTYASGAYNRYMSRAGTALAAAGVLGGNSCSDLSGGDFAVDLDGDGNPDDDDDDTGCGFTLNPFTATKCALRWAFVPSDGALDDRWSEAKSLASSKAPLSVMVGGLPLVTEAFSDIAIDCDADPGECGGIATTDTNRLCAPIAGTNTITDPACTTNANFLTTAGDLMQESSWGISIYGFLTLSIWVGLFLWIWRRVSRSVGSRE